MDILVDVLNVIAGPDFKDVTSIKSEFKNIKLEDQMNLKELKIGIPQVIISKINSNFYLNYNLKEFFPNGLSDDNLEAWKNSVDIIDKKGNSKIVTVSLPNVTYSMSCYSVLTSCEVASNFSRYDGLRYGYHSKIEMGVNQSDQTDYDLEKVIKKNRNESLGPVVKSRIVSGNYFLLKK